MFGAWGLFPPTGTRRRRSEFWRRRVLPVSADEGGPGSVDCYLEFPVMTTNAAVLMGIVAFVRVAVSLHIAQTIGM